MCRGFLFFYLDSAMTLYKVAIKFHFGFLYVFMYSIFRNLNGFVEITDATERVITNLIYGFGSWFIGSNLFFFLRESETKETWGREDYLSPYVLAISLTIIVLLEVIVYLPSDYGGLAPEFLTLSEALRARYHHGTRHTILSGLLFLRGS